VAAAAPARAADLEAGRQKSEPCKACHGADGNASIPGTPSIAGQPVYFTHWQLIKYRDGRRKDPQMSALAANLSDTDMADLAAFYATQRPTPRPAASPWARRTTTAELRRPRRATTRRGARPSTDGPAALPRRVGMRDA